MPWLTPSIIATAAGTALLSFVYYHLYFLDRKKYLGIWAVSWSVYFVRFVFMLGMVTTPKNEILLIGNQLSSLLSGIILLWGTYQFIDRKFPKIWLVCSGIGTVWIILSISMKFSFFLMSIPTFTFLAIVYIWTGLIFLKSKITRSFAKTITGVAFVIWGIHKINYPFLRPVAWFAPWGYLLAAVLEFIVALGMLLVYFQKVRNDLKESEDQFRYLSEGSMEALFFTKDGVCLEANHVAAEIFGYDNRSEFIGMFGTTIIAPESHDIVKSNMLADRFEPYEAIGMRKDGTRFPISIRAKAMPHKDAGIIRVTSITDISKIKQAERALRESEQDLKESQRIAHVGSWRLDLASNQVVWSEELYKMYGFDPTSPPPAYTEHQKLFTPESWNKLHIALNNTIDTGIPYELELEILRDDGKRGWMWVHGEAVRDARGVTVGLRGATQDITGRKQTDEALKASEKKYQYLFENAQVALFRNRLSDGKLLEINERYAKMAGYSNIQDCMAEFNAADAWVELNGRKVFLDILRKNGFVSDYETEIIRRDGTTIWISFSATIFPEQGFLEGSIVEITERKRAEIEREKLQAQLIHAQKMESVGRLAGGVAHDFNNMLSIILGNTEMIIEDTGPDNPFSENLEEIYKAAERSANLTRQLLAFARKQTIDPKILNLNHILDDMLKMLKRLIGENIDLTWQPAQNLWSVKIDPSQIDQILANLCVNARDAIKSVGKITIETNNISFDEAYCKEHTGFNPGDYVMMAVSDNGSGMDRKTLDNLFEPFFTTKDIGQGTGLGLATVYGIVKQNDGFINVYSEPGEGTTFKIYLPVYSETAVSKQKDFKQRSLTGNETILLVEDEEAILRMIKMMLERLGYNVLAATTPNEAVKIVEKSKPGVIHLLMTDVVMPQMNGRDLSKKILRMYPGLKCLFMSGYTANVIAHHGILDTGVQFINKPFSKQDLATKVRDVLDEAKGVA